MKSILMIAILLVFVPIAVFGNDETQAADEFVSEKVAKEFNEDLSSELVDFIDEVDPPDNGAVAELPKEIPDEVSTIDDLVNQEDESPISKYELSEMNQKSKSKTKAATTKPVRVTPLSGALKKLKSGFHKTQKVCPVYSSPQVTAQKDGKVSQGRKVWADVVNNKWVKIYRKKGQGFISTDCIKSQENSSVSAL